MMKKVLQALTICLFFTHAAHGKTAMLQQEQPVRMHHTKKHTEPELSAPQRWWRWLKDASHENQALLAKRLRRSATLQRFNRWLNRMKLWLKDEQEGYSDRPGRGETLSRETLRLYRGTSRTPHEGRRFEFDPRDAHPNQALDDFLEGKGLDRNEAKQKQSTQQRNCGS